MERFRNSNENLREELLRRARERRAAADLEACALNDERGTSRGLLTRLGKAMPRFFRGRTSLTISEKPPSSPASNTGVSHGTQSDRSEVTEDIDLHPATVLAKPDPPNIRPSSSIYDATPRLSAWVPLQPPPVQNRIVDGLERSGGHHAGLAEGVGVKKGKEGRGKQKRRRGVQAGTRKGRGEPPRHFLFCLPWVQSRRLRALTAECFVTGMTLLSMGAVYIGLAATKKIHDRQLAIILIIVTLITFALFVFTLVRLCLALVKGRQSSSGREDRHGVGRNEYAVPHQPIPVIMAHDGEALDPESEWTHFKPPAYGRWRESVKIDPARLRWQRVKPSADKEQWPLGQSHFGPHPPPYILEDGMSDEVDGIPRWTSPVARTPAATYGVGARQGGWA